MNICLSIAAVEIEFKEIEYVVRERTGMVDVCLVKSGKSKIPSTVYLLTRDIPNNESSATSRDDYLPLSREPVVFSAEEAEKCVRVTIVDDVLVEKGEFFEVIVVKAANDSSVTIGKKNVSSVNILDNDGEEFS